MLSFALAGLAGVVLLLRLPSLLNAYALLVAAGLCLLLAAGLHLWRGPLPNGSGLWRLRGSLLLGAVALGLAGWASLVSAARLADRLAPADDGGLHSVVVEVEGLPQWALTAYGQPSWRFEGRLIEGLRVGARGQFSWTARAGESLPDQLQAGDRWHATLRLRNASGTRNPYGFDPETWLFSEGRLLSGSVATGTGGQTPRLLDQSQGFLARGDRLRQRVRDQIQAALDGQAHWGVLSGLTVGDQRSIDRESWKVFAETGVSHLISISGMHVTMFAALARLLVGWLWRFGAQPPLRLPLYVPTPVASALAASLAAMAYALLAGFNIPAQRTAFMVSVAALASLSGLRASPWGVIGLTLLLVLVFDPIAPLSPGFWLSFVAVAILFGQPETRSAWRSAVQAQWAITLGLAPLTAALFQQVSLVGPLANAIAIPVVTFVVTPLAMLGAVGLSVGLEAPLAWGRLVFEWLYVFLEWAADRSWASLAWHSPPAWAALLAGAGALLALQHRLPGWRRLGWLACLLLLLGRPPQPAEGSFQAVFWDVGQGSAILIRTAHHSLLVDTGPTMGSATAAERILAPQLWGMGLDHLSGLLISHADDDHASGTALLKETFRPDWLITSLSVPELNRLLGAPQSSVPQSMVACQLGLAWVWDGVWFRVLSPFSETDGRTTSRGPSQSAGGPTETLRQAAGLGRTGNDASCVLEVTDSAGRRLILPGDVSAGVERQMVEQLPWMENGSPTVLALAHHGSKTSSDEAFLSALQPKAVVTQSAYRGRFQHPHPEVLDRLAEAQIPIYRTDLQGALALEWRGSEPEIRPLAQAVQRFWHLPRY